MLGWFCPRKYQIHKAVTEFWNQVWRTVPRSASVLLVSVYLLLIVRSQLQQVELIQLGEWLLFLVSQLTTKSLSLSFVHKQTQSFVNAQNSSSGSTLSLWVQSLVQYQILRKFNSYTTKSNFCTTSHVNWVLQGTDK